MPSPRVTLALALIAAAGCRADPDGDLADAHPTADVDAVDLGAADAEIDAFDPAPDAAPALPGCAPNPITTCFRGLAFADCGADGPPALYCSGGPDDTCLWFTGGCPALEFPHPGWRTRDQNCVGGSHIAWGADPWIRDRAMTLDVVLDAALDGPADPTLDCACADGPPCLGRRPICRTDELDGYTAVRSPSPDADDWALPGLIAFSLHARGEIAAQTSDHALIVEVDLYADPPAARACLHPTSDGAAFGEPLCALGGRVTLDARPSAPGEVDALRGRVEARFGDVDFAGVDAPVGDLVLHATF